MSMITYLIWLLAFVAGVAVSYFVPEATLSLPIKFIFLGAWGAALGFALFYSSRNALKNALRALEEAEEQRQSPRTEYIPVVPSVGPESSTPLVPPHAAHKDSGLPEGAVPAAEALAAIEAHNAAAVNQVSFPLEAWDAFCKDILKNRPFPDVISSLEKVLPQLFPKASGVLYMYGGVQTELHKIFSFGEYTIGDDVMMPAECASFNRGDIVVTDFNSPTLSDGCTHLHHHPQGIAFCAPIEGLEEHFGILTIQVDELPQGETVDFWKAKVSIVAATFGLYVANQNLNVRFEQHSIRDTLTGLFNKRYMEESLRREIASATRHNTPIGMIMMRPDAIAEIQKTRGRHAVEQMLWEIGQRIPNYIRLEDIPCRYDGDVFCVILPGADLKITRDRAEKIRYELSQLQIAYGDSVLSSTLSLGVSVMPVHAPDAGSLIMMAQEAMRLAIQSGTNRVVLADALM